MEVADFLEMLSGVKPNGNGWSAQCPAHEDKSPSFSVAVKNERIVVKCFAGCEFPSIVSSMGLKEGDFFMEEDRQKREPIGKPVAEWIYRDEEGNPAYKTIRFEREDGTKTFRQKHLEGSEWLWGMNGQKRYPYRLPELLEAAKSRWIAIVEGEKCVDQMEKLGIFATTNAEGAGKWRDEWFHYFDRAKVVLVPDNDEVGRSHMRGVARSIAPYVADMRWLELPGIPAKGDVVDWAEAGGSSDQIKSLILKAPPFAAQTEIYELVSDLMTKDLPKPRWVIPGLLVEGLTLLAGDPKAGKSFLALDWLGGAGGYGRVFGNEPVETGSSLYFALEDPEWRLQSRLWWAFGDTTPPNMRYSVRSRPIPKSAEWRSLEEWLASHPECRIIAVDTLTKIWETESKFKKDTGYHSESAMLSRLKELADKYHVAVVVVHHLRKENDKGLGSGDPFQEISGTQGLFGTADTAMILKRPRESKEGLLIVSGRDLDDITIDLIRSPNFGDKTKSGWHWLRHDLGHGSDTASDMSEGGVRGESEEIVAYLKRSGRAISARYIATRLGKPLEGCRKKLNRLQKAGAVEYAGQDGWRVVNKAVQIYRSQEIS